MSCHSLKFVNWKSFVILTILFGLTTSSIADSKILKPHHTHSGFQNPNPNYERKGFWDVLVWQWDRFFLPYSLDAKTYPPFPILINDGNLLKSNDTKLSVTWVGHATTLVQIDGLNILTDPIWSDRCSPLSFAGPKRYTPPGISLGDLPKIDIVILSHNHYDHTDIPTLRKLEETFHPLVLTGLGNKKLLLGEGLKNVNEMDWWEEISFGSVKLTFTPTQHFSGRSLFDRDETLWGSFMISGTREKVYFAGDTGYFSHFKEIANRFGNIDVAILPIGATEPRWLMEPVHIGPTQAVMSFLDLKAKYLVPMHYMTFVLSDEPLDSPVPRTKEAMKQSGISESAFVPLKIGETRFF